MMLAIIEKRDKELAAAERVIFECNELVANSELLINKQKEQLKLYEDIDLAKYATYDLVLADNKALSKDLYKANKKIKFWKRMTVAVPVVLGAAATYIIFIR